MHEVISSCFGKQESNNFVIVTLCVALNNIFAITKAVINVVDFTVMYPVLSEFEELEAAPGLVEGPLELPPSNIIATTNHAQEDPQSAFFSVWKLPRFFSGFTCIMSSLSELQLNCIRI